MVGKYILSWFGLLIIAVLNGAFRQLAVEPRVGELAAHQISVATCIILFGIATWIVLKLVPLSSAQQAWMAGLLWLAMTVSFEFLFFHFARGVAWEVLLHDYNILQGRLWILVLIWVATTPRILLYFQQR